MTYFLPSDDDQSSKGKGSGGGGGGFIHRDSLGVKQKYGTKGNYRDQAQWLFTGSGMLHEEMFDFEENKEEVTDWTYQSRYELYQLWVNVPSHHKLDPPKVQLLRTTSAATADNDNDKNKMNGATTITDDAEYDENDDGSMPTVSTSTTTTTSSSPSMLTTTTNCDVVVIAGTYAIYDKDSSSDGSDSDVDVDIDVDFVTSQAKPLHSDLSVLHVAITETETEAKAMTTTTSTTTTGGDTRGWTYHIPNNHETLIVYVRKGSCSMVTKSSSSSSSSSNSDVYDDDTTNNAVDNIYNVDSTSSSANEKKKQSQSQQQQQPTIVPIHSTVFIETPKSDTNSRSNHVNVDDKYWNCDRLIITPLKFDEPVDLLVLSGCPLYADNNNSNVLEPIASQGSMVMNYPSEIDMAYRDYQIGKMGVPWDYQLTDEEWRDHIQKTTPSPTTTTTMNRSSVVSSLREEEDE